MEHLLFDSGEDDEGEQSFLSGETEVWSREHGITGTVEAGSDAGEKAVSEVQFFETGKREEVWSAKWISCRQ